MKTDDLIIQLAQDTQPQRRHTVVRRLMIGIGLGTAISTAIVVLWLGPRHDLGMAMHRVSYWIKWVYTLSLSAAALTLTSRLARPDASRVRGVRLIAAPVLLLAGVSVIELVRAPRSDWSAMWLGQTWSVCPWLVLILAIPIFGGLLWAFRTLAPTRLSAAGASAGLAAGSFASSVYCLHCPEVSAIFVLTWYSLGILVATLSGALLGPRLLRW